MGGRGIAYLFSPRLQFLIGQPPHHYFEKREAAVTGRAKLVEKRVDWIRRGSEIAVAFDSDAIFEVALVCEDFFDPAKVAKCQRGAIVFDGKMLDRFTGLGVREPSTNKAGLNWSDFEFTKAEWALFVAAHSLVSKLGVKMGSGREIERGIGLPQPTFSAHRPETSCQGQPPSFQLEGLIGKLHAGLKVFAVQVWKLGQNLVERVAGRDVFEHRFHRVTKMTDAGFPMADIRVDGDPGREIGRFVIHSFSKMIFGFQKSTPLSGPARTHRSNKPTQSRWELGDLSPQLGWGACAPSRVPTGALAGRFPPPPPSLMGG